MIILKEGVQVQLLIRRHTLEIQLGCIILYLRGPSGHLHCAKLVMPGNFVWMADQFHVQTLQWFSNAQMQHRLAGARLVISGNLHLINVQWCFHHSTRRKHTAIIQMGRM